MPSGKYYIDQAKTLLAWAHTTPDKAHARKLREKAGDLLQQAQGARAAVPDLNPLLAHFNNRQMRGRGPEDGAGG